MNRHERRKQKKSNKSNLLANNEIVTAIKLHTQQNFSVAEKMYNSILRKNPKNYEAVRHLGILYYDTNRKEEAYNSFLNAVRLFPDRCEAFNNLGFIHLENMNYSLAEKCFKESLKKNNTYLPALNNIVSLYIKLSEKDKALSISKKAMSLDSNNQLARNQHAKALILNNKIYEGLEILEKLCVENPLPDFLLNLSVAYRELGETKKADDIIISEFNKNYKYENFFHTFAKTKGVTLNTEQIQYYEEKIRDNEVSKPALNKKVLICESLFDYYRNKKDFNKSGAYLKKMNEIQYGLEEFSLKKEENLFNRLKQSNKLIKKLDNSKDSDSLTPIIICGMPRSGTTLCEQILSSHSNVTGAGELNYLSEFSGLKKLMNTPEENIKIFEENVKNNNKLIEIRDNYLRSLNTHRDEKANFVCDKMPHNFLLIGLLRNILPKSKIIYCKRDAMDNCFSLYSHKWIEMSHQYSYNQKVLANYYKLHEDLMSFWIDEYSDIFILDNEKLVSDQKKTTEELLDYCELNWEDACLEFYKNKRQVRTASIDQVRRPINNKSIGAWKKYSNDLEDLTKHLNKQ